MQPIVKQPIHDSKGNVWGYEILYSNNEQWSGDKSSDAEAASAVENLLLQCNSEDFLENRMTFVAFTQNLLVRKVPDIFSSDTLVIEIDHDTLLSQSALEMVQEYHTQGYKIALIGFDFTSLYLSTLNVVDFVKLSFQNADNYASLKSAIDVIHKLGKSVIGYNVNSEEAYKAAMELQVPFLQGVYIAAALPTTSQRVEHLPSNFFELMVAIFQDEPDINVIAEIISRDVTLTYSILKLVNSAFFSLRAKVESVSHALMILGIAQLKQWIYLLSFKHDGNVPKDFIKLSLMRANFCQELHAYVKDIPISNSEAYLMGMFSTLDALLQRPLSDVLQDLNISEYVKDALLKKEGATGLLYELVLSYETGNWHKISDFAERLGVPASVISQKYFECMDTVNTLWKKLAQDI
ncbi:HDOD domain-containing protein [Christensenellaceae bacterium OttesenSCG-928-M15]|nr:HDOD domain-containing protein [Christensenellaceae bacterium OttesenSCG-928-M15]